MEKYTINSPLQSEESIVAHLAEKVLNEALLNYKIEKLRGEIDTALSERNKEQFLKLSEQLITLRKKLN